MLLSNASCLGVKGFGSLLLKTWSAVGTSFQDFARVTQTGHICQPGTQKKIWPQSMRLRRVCASTTEPLQWPQESRRGDERWAARVRVVRRLRDHAVSVQDLGGHRERRTGGCRVDVQRCPPARKNPAHSMLVKIAADPHFFLGAAPKSVYQQDLTDERRGQERGHACISMEAAQSPAGCRRDQGDQGEKHRRFVHRVPQIYFFSALIFLLTVYFVLQNQTVV